MTKQVNTLELFQPLILKKMIQLKLISSLREGKKTIKREKDITEGIVRKIITKVRFKKLI